MNEQIDEKKEFTIPLVLGEETRPKIEMFDGREYSVKIENSIFYQQYKKALSGIAELVIYNSKHLSDDNLNSHNNIFIFNGERGSGKTSCMLTVCELLCNKNSKKERYEKLNLSSALSYELEKTIFQKIDLIDPIYFDYQHNILDLFIGTLFKKFQDFEKDKQYNPNKNIQSKDGLLGLFSKTKRNLSILNKTFELSEFDDLEQLNDLAVSISLEQNIEKLVKSYIQYVHTPETQLVLCIDDIDLNMSEGYQMVEQIRKYLNIPGLIILMAVKIEQLANVIRIKYSNDFAPLKNKKKYDEIINGIVERYITKSFPLNQRIQLPSVAYLLNQTVGIFRYEGESLKCIEVFSPLKDELLKLIYKKIRLLVYNTSERINYIVPRNLRELLNLMHLLYSLDDAKDHKDTISNLVHFKGYFYGGWCTNNLDEDGLIFMRSTQDVITPDVINQMVVRFLKKRFPILANLEKAKEENDYSIKELIYILNDENIMYNLSLGDVLACLDWLDKICDKEKDLKLLFAIKIFYSISLYENFSNQEEIFEGKAKTQQEIINKGKLTKNETSYGNIVNGNFFNSEYLNVAPYEKGEISRCRRIVNHKKMAELWNKGEKELVEFFMLTTSFVIDSKDKDINSASTIYRKRMEVYYEKEIGANRQNICFDVLSIFYNLANIRKTYERFHFFLEYEKKEMKQEQLKKEPMDLIENWVRANYKGKTEEEILQKKKEKVELEIFLNAFTKICPLYKNILNHIKYRSEKVEKEENTEKNYFNNLFFLKERELLYTLNIRNVEILEQISYTLQSYRPDTGQNNIENLIKVFNTLSIFEIQIYSSENIKFEFFKAISTYLSDVKANSKEKNFNKVYSNDSSIRKTTSRSNKTTKSNILSKE